MTRDSLPGNGRGSVFQQGVSRLVFLLSEDHKFGREMSRQLYNYGYEAHHFVSAEDLDNRHTSGIPSAVIVDMKMPDRDTGMVLAALTQTAGVMVPVIVLSAETHFEARLQAVRYGASGFFPRHTPAADIIAFLDVVTDLRLGDAYRVLILAEDKAVTSQCAEILTQAGLTAHEAHNPLAVTEVLHDTNPDVILMSLYFDDCAGMELAEVIRQQQGFQSLPIVFLSPVVTLDERMAAMKRGGDDFLSLPVDPEMLVASVGVSAARSRAIAVSVDCDSMTGLLGHSVFRRRLDAVAQRSGTNGMPFCVALLDIDHFKHVNSVQGHAAGDRVIKNLSRLLRQRLRHSDILCRYGGEEFAIVLTDTEIAVGLRVMDHVRSAFSEIPQEGGSDVFFCSFSCGIAASTSGDVQSLLTFADRGLYAAKESGRNRVVRGDLPIKPK